MNAARIFSTSYDFDTNHIKVVNIKTKQVNKHIPEEFIYGNGLFNEETDNYPQYVHADAWKAVTIGRRDNARGRVINKEGVELELKKALTLETKKLKSLNLAVIVKNYHTAQPKGIHRKLYLDTFEESHRKIVSVWYRTSKRWLKKGYPERYTFKTTETRNYLDVIIKFFEGLDK